GLVNHVRQRAGGVSAYRGRIDQSRHLCRGDSLEDPFASVHVHFARAGLIARWLDQPGEVDDDLGAIEQWPQLVAGDVCLSPSRLLKVGVWKPSRDPDDLADGGVLGERLQDA